MKNEPDPGGPFANLTSSIGLRGERGDEPQPSSEADLSFETIGYEEFAPDVTTVAEVRQFVRQILENHGFNSQSVFACELIADELATNALKYSGMFYSVAIELSNVSVRIAVRDDSRVLPALREYAIDTDEGRGLSIVSKTSTDWGIESLGLGKETWADVAAEPVPTEFGS
jgi:anti-sigma regulatory factor (Ser/Thr protein kinase)